jgi:hypothetical protein
LPLPGKRFDAAEVEPRQIGDDFCIPWDTNRYSADPDHTGKQAWVRVLMGELEIAVNVDGVDTVVGRHQLKATRHQRYVLPEHEAKFRQRSRSRHVLAEQFSRLGSGADEFMEGLREAKGAAAGYHMSLILRLADRKEVGPRRVAEALRHAARYGAFDAHAVARIVTGRRLPLAPLKSKEAALPAPVGEFLKGAGSFQRSVKAYERLAQASSDESRKDEPNGK